MSSDEGYGYEWDAMLIGGPADGCLDRVITINNDKPPETITKIMDGQIMRRESLGEKLIEKLTRDEIDGSQKVAVYLLRKVDDSDRCEYDFLEIITMEEYRINYEDE
jgi:hypothetical protein